MRLRPRKDRSNWAVFGHYDPNDILELTGPHAGTLGFYFGSALLYVDLWDDRYIVMKRDNCTCQHCGRVGTVMLLERMMPLDNNPKNIYREPHFNLYHVQPDGSMILMTMDHIHPKSRGGRNSIENYQLLCEPCNRKKKNKVDYSVPKSQSA